MPNKLIVLLASISLLFQVKSETCTPTSTTCCSGSLSIESTMTSITDSAYEDCGTITSVTVPSLLTDIGTIFFVVFVVVVVVVL